MEKFYSSEMNKQLKTSICFILACSLESIVQILISRYTYGQ